MSGVQIRYSVTELSSAILCIPGFLGGRFLYRLIVEPKVRGFSIGSSTTRHTRPRLFAYRSAPPPHLSIAIRTSSIPLHTLHGPANVISNSPVWKQEHQLRPTQTLSKAFTNVAIVSVVIRESTTWLGMFVRVRKP